MAKGIIVVDMPESCDKCPYELSKDWVCSLTKSDTFINYGMDRFKKGLMIVPSNHFQKKWTAKAVTDYCRSKSWLAGICVLIKYWRIQNEKSRFICWFSQ